MSDAFTPTYPVTLPNRKARRIAAARVRARERRLREERREALNDPDHADVRPATISIRDFKLATGLSNATIFRRLADGTLKSIKVGGRRLISYDEIERLRAGE